jgi:hypothetical protein
LTRELLGPQPPHVFIVDIYPKLYVMAPEVVSWISNTIKTTLASLHRFWRKNLCYLLMKI